jgi:hypothetical protein
MRRTTILALAAALLTADAAAAATLPADGHPAASRLRTATLPAPRLGRGRRLNAGLVRVSTADPAVPAEFGGPGPGDGDKDGWFQAGREAGWGIDQGGAQTVVGLYQRPAQPDIPGPQVSPVEGRGAAGLSLSFKLGR